VVEHRAGSKISHVYVLSRSVGAITHTNSLEKENILQEQKADAFCCTQSPGAYSSKSELFLDNEGMA